MIRNPDPYVQREIEDALRSESPAALTDYEFWVGLSLLNDRTETLSYGREGDSLAVALDSSLAGPIAPSLKGQDVSVDVLVAGHPTRRFTGQAHKPVGEGIFRSRLLANTAGWWATGDSAVKLGSERRFSGYSHRRAAEEMLFRLPYEGEVDVEDSRVRTGFERGVTEPFSRVVAVGEILGAITEESKLVFKDTRLGGVRGRVPTPAVLAGDPEWTFRMNRDFAAEGAFSYSPRPQTYYDVLAWRLRPDGTVEELAYAEIPDAGNLGAPEDATYLIPIETEGPRAYEEGVEQVNEAITGLVHGTSEWSLEIDWVHALMEEDDVVRIEEVTEDERDLILRTWTARIDHIAEDPYALSQTLSGAEATYTEERARRGILVPRLPGSEAVIPA